MSVYSLTYDWDLTTIKSAIKREVSKEASLAVNKDGASLYDIVKLYSNDDTTLEGIIMDGVRTLIAGFHDIATSHVTSNSAVGIIFNVPDYDTSLESTTKDDISRFLAQFAIALWFEEKLPDISKIFSERASASLLRIGANLRHRKAITRNVSDNS